jgi:hypothetical protein
LRVTPVAVVAGEHGVLAQIFARVTAIAATAAASSKPWHPDALPDRKALYAVASANDNADDLVTWNKRRAHCRQLAVDDMQIGAAHAARSNLE